MRINAKWFLILTLVIAAGTSCQSLRPGSDQQAPPTSKIKTIHPATLTAISELAGKTPTPDPASLSRSADQANQVNLRIGFIGEHIVERQAMENLVRQFNKENSWQISAELIDPRHDYRVEASLMEGKTQPMPDLVLFPGPVLSSWAETEEVVDLNLFVDHPDVGWDSKVWDNFYPPLGEPLLTSEGKRLAIPFSQDLQVMYYNRSWAETLGFPTPPKTSGELRAQVCASAADYFSENPDTKTGMGGLLLYPATENIIPWISAYGGSLFDPGSKQYRLTHPSVKTVAREWWLMQQRGCAYTFDQPPNPLLDEKAYQAFNNREALVMMGSAADFPQIHILDESRGLSDSWMMLPFLGPQGQMAVAASIQVAAIPVSSPEQEMAAWMFLDYLVSPEIQADWIIKTGLYPIRDDMDQYLEDYQQNHSQWAQGMDLIPYLQPEPQSHSYLIIRPLLSDGFSAVLNGGYKGIVPVLEELDDLAKELHAGEWE